MRPSMCATHQSPRSARTAPTGRTLIASDILAGFETAIGGGAEALVVLPDGMFWNERARIVALAAKYRIPAI